MFEYNRTEHKTNRELFSIHPFFQLFLRDEYFRSLILPRQIKFDSKKKNLEKEWVLGWAERKSTLCNVCYCSYLPFFIVHFIKKISMSYQFFNPIINKLMVDALARMCSTVRMAPHFQWLLIFFIFFVRFSKVFVFILNSLIGFPALPTLNMLWNCYTFFLFLSSASLHFNIISIIILFSSFIVQFLYFSLDFPMCTKILKHMENMTEN